MIGPDRPLGCGHHGYVYDNTDSNESYPQSANAVYFMASSLRLRLGKHCFLGGGMIFSQHRWVVVCNDSVRLCESTHNRRVLGSL